MKYFLFPLIIVSTCTFAAQVLDNNCKSPISSTGMVLMDKMREDMHVDTKSIPPENITTQLLFNEPVTDILSDYYARESYNTEGIITQEKYKKIYSQFNPRNLIIKFTVKNKQGKEDVFLVSTIANDYECNIEFNGYIIVKREF
ncbi:hypothetical protein [Erwinia sp. CGal63]|uniref:hypothetical protein n=1 Tax=Erwinia sp. CGal63 TaxID=2919889 RepID=UPI00300B782D